MLAQFLQKYKPVFVLTGAGASTASGIPDYRDKNGAWKHTQPIRYQDFLRHENMRKRYWARSMNGWPHIQAARPNDAHIALRQMEDMGLISAVVTQNVDGLHQQAGSRAVIDLHGTIHKVRCLDCHSLYPRHDIQHELEAKNPGFINTNGDIKPDGDAAVVRHNLAEFRLPYCPCCHGTVKPDVVFFGENVPRERKDSATQRLIISRGMLVAGSSLMVYSGYRFCQIAQQYGIPIVSVNQGVTRADDEFLFKLDAECGSTLRETIKTLRQG